MRNKDKTCPSVLITIEWDEYPACMTGKGCNYHFGNCSLPKVESNKSAPFLFLLLLPVPLWTDSHSHNIPAGTDYFLIDFLTSKSVWNLCN